MIKELFRLVISFMKIGVLTFGGGLAMLPMLERELIEHREWVTREELLNYYAVSQCTPGVIAVNTATFVGYKRAKIPGAIMATAGVVLPSLIIIVAVATVLSRFSHLPAVQHAFIGIRAAVAALILAAIVKLAKSNFKKPWQIIVAICSFVLVAAVGLNPVFAVIGAAAAGLLISREIPDNGSGKTEKDK